MKLCNLAPRFGVAQFDHYDPLASIEQLTTVGFDYVEQAVIKVMEQTEAQFRETLARSSTAEIHVEAMNSFLPADLKVVGPRIDQPRLLDYLQQSFDRAQSLGAQVIIFGSGDSRMVPDGFSRERAMEQLAQFLHMAGDEIVQKQYGMTIAIEALRKAECNIINLAAESYTLAVKADHPKVKIIVDFFHLANEEEDPEILKKVEDHLIHIHFSDPAKGRLFPRRTAAHPLYRPFFSALRDIDYQGRISLEAFTENFAVDATEGLATMRSLYSAACAK